jgi:hypothetical protein
MEIAVSVKPTLPNHQQVEESTELLQETKISSIKGTLTSSTLKKCQPAKSLCSSKSQSTLRIPLKIGNPRLLISSSTISRRTSSTLPFTTTITLSTKSSSVMKEATPTYFPQKQMLNLEPNLKGSPLPVKLSPFVRPENLNDSICLRKKFLPKKVSIVSRKVQSYPPKRMKTLVRQHRPIEM